MKARLTVMFLILASAMAGPALAQTGVYVSQIGSANTAKASQDANAVAGYTKIEQDGERNKAEVIQQNGKHDARVTQKGTLNDAYLIQSGDEAHQATLSQDGTINRIKLAQSSNVAAQVAILTQEGTNNEIILSQEGAQNIAELKQTGDNNLMKLGQTGGGNVTWTQDGNNLAPVELAVGGAQVMILTQTKP